MGHLQRLNKYIFRYKWRLFFGILCVFLTRVFETLIPHNIGKTLDYTLNKAQELRASGESVIANEEIQSHLINFTLQILSFGVMMGIFMYFTRKTIIVNSRLIEYDLKRDLYDHYQKLDQSFYRKNKTGDLMARITEDVNKVRNYLGPAMLYGLNLICLFVVVIFFMVKVNLRLTLWTLLPLPFLSLSIYMVSSRIHQRSEIIQQQLAALNSMSQEVFSGISIIKSYVKESNFSRLFRIESDEFLDKSLDLAKVNSMFFPLMILLTSLSTLIVVVVGGIEYFNGRATLGNLTEFIIYVNLLTWPVTSIGWIASLVQEASASQKRINEFWDTEPLISDQDTAKMTNDIEGEIIFHNVSYTYEDSGIEALKNINLTIRAGDKIIIMGKTASGKTTLADLILRLFDPTEGYITLDGIDLREYSLETLRKKIGYVTQDVFLFSDTVGNNLRLATESSTDTEVMRYAKYASLDEDIRDLPLQLETLVGERGISLSGGQKQRLSIARTFITNPDVLILDDCLSAVDTKTETNILSYFNEALKNKTALIITHRLFASLEVDQVIILEEGRIVEKGTPEELIALKGRYADYYDMNEAGYE